MAAHDKAEELAIAERRAKVAANLLGGLSQRQMAEALGVSTSTIKLDVAAILEEYREQRIEKIEKLKELENVRLNRALNAIWNQVLAGDLEAIDRFLKISDARRKLLGLDVPRTTRHLHDFGNMTRDELVQYISSRIGQVGDVGSGGGSPEGQYLPGPSVIDGDFEEMA